MNSAVASDAGAPRAFHPKATLVILTTQVGVETWLTAPTPDALALQRPLPDGALKIVARCMRARSNGRRGRIGSAAIVPVASRASDDPMKIFASGLLVLGLLAIQVSEANAAACAAGPHRAGCVGPHGAVGVHRGYGYGRGTAVVRPAYGAHCYWRAGVRVCR